MSVPGADGVGEVRGTNFGKYQLFATLGRGGMADVFLSVARGQMGFNKLAVIKRLRQSLAEEPGFLSMFLDEARLAARLSHPNIVHTYEVGEQHGVYFIAMEFLEGQSLNKVLKEARSRKEMIEPEIAVRIVADALAGLGYAHELRDYDGRPLSVIHRDVSPHNVFVTYDGHTKLVDFGIAKAALSSTETEVGVLKGKVAYMSPEQAMGHRIDARSDLFAMGIVLWELLARQRLMTGDSAASTLHKLMNEPIPRVSQVLPSIDPALDALVARALEKDPKARWSSATDMRSALESWLTTQRPVRQEDVGRRLLSLFWNVREEVQRQIQAHMTSLTSASTTQELKALTDESLHRMNPPRAQAIGSLAQLDGSGSTGSGVVAGYGGLASPPSMFPNLPNTSSRIPPPPRNSSHALPIVIAIGCFFLTGLLIVVLGTQERRRPLGIDVSASAVTVGVPPLPAPTEASGAGRSAIVTATAAPSPVMSSPVTPSADVSVVTKSPLKATAPRTATAVRPAPQEEPGFVTVSAYPWAKVSEGGTVVCPITPCNKVQMSAGTHSLTFENGESPGQKQVVTVVVKSGETSTKNVGFK